MLEDEGSALLGMALDAGLVLAGQRGAAALDGVAFVRVMAIGAGHLAIEHLVAVGQHELGLGIEVTLEAGFRRLVRIDDGAKGPSGLDMFAARAVAGLATHVDGVLALGLESGVIGGFEIAHDLLVALGAFLGAHKLGPGNTHGCHDGATARGAGNQDQGRRSARASNPQQVSLSLTNPAADCRGGGWFPGGFHGALLRVGKNQDF
ncbi:MAG: hypothetical protein MUC40_07810 [Akkermansiaceae bacterium]|nr:hypothetical protein [Akkermansiaceae bacterium]